MRQGHRACRNVLWCLVMLMADPLVTMGCKVCFPWSKLVPVQHNQSRLFFIKIFVILHVICFFWSFFFWLHALKPFWCMHNQPEWLTARPCFKMWYDQFLVSCSLLVFSLWHFVTRAFNLLKFSLCLWRLLQAMLQCYSNNKCVKIRTH